ncbi:MAG TPA: metallophosphoesterase [Thermoanaerobaculia bacterium]|nr:metallophosphoesterase [Thermoanaerobaculia bacterium]
MDMRKTWQARLFAATFVLLVCVANAGAADPAWLEYGPDGALARTIVTNGGECPEIDIDRRRTRMRVHAEPAKNYDVRVCEAAIPGDARSASIGGHALPVAKLGRAEKVAIVGDTGCRRKGGSPVQDCSDPKKWPFAAVAASIAAWDPDIVLHVGDYYYREAATCDKSGTCSKNTFYDWSRWNADFFTPADPLLRNAPWIVVRGNHEMCGRAAEGWVRFLEPRNYVWENNATCMSNLQFTPPYRVSAGALNVTVMDSSSVQESSEQQVPILAGQLALLANAPANTWLMMHHPIWADDLGDPVTETLWGAWQQAGSTTSAVSLLLTGHIHMLEMISFTDNGVPLIVAGNGGTALDKAPTNAPGLSVGPRVIKNFTADDDFGFITATPGAEGWTFEIRDRNGRAKTRCGGTATSLVCD